MDNYRKISEMHQKKALDYLEEFFDIIRDDGEFQDRIVGECRG